MLLTCFTIGIAFITARLAYTNVQQTTQDETMDTDDQEDSDEPLSYIPVDETEAYEGVHVNATLHTGWSIVELTDNAGMEMYADDGSTVITGLSGLEVYDENSVKVFSFNGVDGIGGIEACSEVGVFSDTETSHLQNINAANAEVGEAAAIEVDLSGEVYSDIEMLGLRMRRLGTTLYFAASDAPSAFNTLCGLNSQFVIIPGVSFTVAQTGLAPYTGSSYAYEIFVSDEAILEKLGDVLNSLTQTD